MRRQWNVTLEEIPQGSVRGQIRLAPWNRWPFYWLRDNVKDPLKLDAAHVNNTGGDVQGEGGARRATGTAAESLDMWEGSLMLLEEEVRLGLTRFGREKHWGVCLVTENQGIVQLSTRQQPPNSRRHPSQLFYGEHSHELNMMMMYGMSFYR